MSYHYGEIPISKVTKNGLKNLLKIEERLFKRVIGQNNTVVAISEEVSTAKIFGHLSILFLTTKPP